MFHFPLRFRWLRNFREKIKKIFCEKMSELKTVVDEKVSDPEEVASNEEAENDTKDVTSKKKKKKKRNKGK